MRFNKPCLNCGRLSPDNYCLPCKAAKEKERNLDPIRAQRKRELYGPRYRRLAPIIRATAETCHICGKGYIANDPWEADHLDPTLGDASPLASAHRSCNQARGNKPLEQ